ncbi:hypothetical protein Bcoa_3310 [Heyndrickxia coagulans 36D1]|jgi:hypothetical protein|uniref:Uncharacterized protein n=1 Tax=Heyndrickxia coagulans 36D1 TaxID=345219 RepID=G2TMI4_HEYCO|nr:hypothetical protein Bcoa_3310 [Heyndrickxia coagulans 36D1]
MHSSDFHLQMTLQTGNFLDLSDLVIDFYFASSY